MEEYVNIIVNGEIKKVTKASLDVPQLTEEQARFLRDKLLSKTDWWAVQDRTMSQEEKDYRQALRDITSQEGFPENIVWPTKPV